MNNNQDNLNELEQLREQMAVFKAKVNKQEIINEQLVRHSMTSKLSWIKKFVWVEILSVPFLLAVFALLHANEGYSWWLYAFLAIGLIADVVGDYRINNISKEHLMSNDLMETSQRLVMMKKYRNSWFIAGIIFVIIWLVWFCIETVLLLDMGCTNPDHATVVSIIVGALVLGGLIGMGIAWLIFRKMQKTNNQVIEQINQITSDGQET